MDIRILKVILYSRAVTIGLRMLGQQTGLFVPIAEPPNNEERKFIVESGVVVFFAACIAYSFVFYPSHMDGALYRGIHKMTDMDKAETMFFESIRGATKLYDSNISVSALK